MKKALIGLGAYIGTGIVLMEKENRWASASEGDELLRDILKDEKYEEYITPHKWIIPVYAAVINCMMTLSMPAIEVVLELKDRFE